MNDTPTRRGRRPRLHLPEQVPEQPVSAAEDARPTRRRERGGLNGRRTKLDVPERPGFVRRWFNETPGRLAEAERLAYTPVRDAPSIQSDSTDSLYRRHVGRQEGGAPLTAILMETPLDEYQAGLDDKEEALKPFEDSIRRGEDHLGGVKNSYGHGQINR